MQTVKLRDAVIEWTGSDTHTGPGRTGQRVGSALWYRVDGGAWVMLPYRSGVRWWEALQLAETLAELQELIDAESCR